VTLKITKEMRDHIENSLKRKNQSSQLKAVKKKDYCSMEVIMSGKIMKLQNSMLWIHKPLMNKYLRNKDAGNAIN
jgi:hypothetical protein